MAVPAIRTDIRDEECKMGSRNKQRATFEKRQREMARQERQAEKRARRQAKGEQSGDEDPGFGVITEDPGAGVFPEPPPTPDTV